MADFRTYLIIGLIITLFLFAGLYVSKDRVTKFFNKNTKTIQNENGTNKTVTIKEGKDPSPTIVVKDQRYTGFTVVIIIAIFSVVIYIIVAPYLKRMALRGLQAIDIEFPEVKSAIIKELSERHEYKLPANQNRKSELWESNWIQFRRQHIYVLGDDKLVVFETFINKGEHIGFLTINVNLSVGKQKIMQGMFSLYPNWNLDQFFENMWGKGIKRMANKMPIYGASSHEQTIMNLVGTEQITPEATQSILLNEALKKQDKPKEVKDEEEEKPKWFGNKKNE